MDRQSMDHDLAVKAQACEKIPPGRAFARPPRRLRRTRFLVRRVRHAIAHGRGTYRRQPAYFCENTGSLSLDAGSTNPWRLVAMVAPSVRDSSHGRLAAHCRLPEFAPDSI